MAKRGKSPRAQVPLRIPEAQRARIEKAAKARGVSMNAEIVERLERSFQTEDRLGGPRVAGLIEIVAATMKLVGEQAAFWVDSSRLHNQGGWLDQPYGFEQAKQAAESVIEAHRPPGKIVQPNPRTLLASKRQTKFDPKVLAAQTRENFMNLGKLTAYGELIKRRQDDE